MPWESMDILRGQPVTRMPNMASLHRLYVQQSSAPESPLHLGVSPFSASYVLDPDNNLPRTRARLAKPFEVREELRLFVF